MINVVLIEVDKNSILCCSMIWPYNIYGEFANLMKWNPISRQMLVMFGENGSFKG